MGEEREGRWGLAFGLCQSRGLGARASGVYPAGKLKWRLIGAFLVVSVLGMVCDCNLWPLLRSLGWGGGRGGVLVVFARTMGLCWPEMAL